MSVSKDPAKCTTKDLSDLPEGKGFPAYNSSMFGGNTVTDKNPHFAGQGSDSEGTHDVVSHTVSYVGYSHPTPTLPPDGKDDSHLSTDDKGSGYTPSPRTWKEI